MGASMTDNSPSNPSVSQLRDWAKQCGINGHAIEQATLDGAADEIEQLRADLAEALERHGRLQLTASNVAAERDGLRSQFETKAVELPESLRDPQAVLERGRAILDAIERNRFLEARIGTIRNIAEGPITARAQQDIARLAREAQSPAQEPSGVGDKS